MAFIYNTTQNGDYTEVYPNGLYKCFDKQGRLHNLRHPAQYSLDSEERFVKGSEVYAIHGIIFDTREEWQEQVSHAAGQYGSESYPVKKYIDYKDKTKGYMIYQPKTDVYEYYNQYGQLHNTEGPAILSSKPSEDQFYLNGVEVEYYTWLSFCDPEIMDEKEINVEFPPALKKKIYVKKPVPLKSPSNSNPPLSKTVIKSKSKAHATMKNVEPTKNPHQQFIKLLDSMPKELRENLLVEINKLIESALKSPTSCAPFLLQGRDIAELLQCHLGIGQYEDGTEEKFIQIIAEFVDAEIKKRSDPSYQKVKSALELLDKDTSKVIDFTYLKNQYPELFEQFADKAQ